MFAEKWLHYLKILLFFCEEDELIHLFCEGGGGYVISRHVFIFSFGNFRKMYIRKYILIFKCILLFTSTKIICSSYISIIFILHAHMLSKYLNHRRFTNWKDYIRNFGILLEALNLDSLGYICFRIFLDE